MEVILKRIGIAVIVLMLAISGAAAPSVDKVADDPRVKTALEAARIWLEAQRAYDRIPGVSAAIVYDQQVLWSGGYGHADLSKKTPATAGTIYRICSISKLFTSIAVMQLRDAGKLRLDDPIEKFLPWIKIQRTAPEGPEITIEGLLTHASGLPWEYILGNSFFCCACQASVPPAKSSQPIVKNDKSQDCACQIGLRMGVNEPLSRGQGPMRSK